jgi:outer membrane receptor protein involved in Fe transport
MINLDQFKDSGTEWLRQKNLLDLSVGYRFSPSFRFDVSGTNIADNKYRTFPNLPEIGRRVLGKVTFNF